MLCIMCIIVLVCSSVNGSTGTGSPGQTDDTSFQVDLLSPMINQNCHLTQLSLQVLRIMSHPLLSYEF